MLFYFITHTILGMLAANSTLIQKHAKNDAASYPLWVNGPWGPLVVAITGFSALSYSFKSEIVPKEKVNEFLAKK